MLPLQQKDASFIFDKLSTEVHQLSDSTILLTGAGGFLGFQFLHFFEYCISRGINIKQVIAVDNFIRGRPDWLHDLSDRCKAINIIQSDALDYVPPSSVTHVLHAASIASPIFYRKYPLETIRVNVTGTDRLLSFATKLENLKSFLYFSSSEIYGDPSPEFIPTSEDYSGNVNCIGPRACYDESKRIGETLCYNYYKELGVPTKIVRPFNNYGPGLKLSDRRVLPDMFRSALSDNQLVLLSDGSATRTFCYVADALVGYLKVLFSSHHGTPFNIGSPDPEISISDLAKTLQTIIPTNPSIVYLKSSDDQYLKHNPNRRCPDISRARNLLDFNPCIKLEDGLTRAYEFYNSEYSDFNSTESDAKL